MEFRSFVSRLGSDIVLDRVSHYPAPSGITTVLHTHFNRLHLTCVKRGRGRCAVDGEEYLLSPGTVHLVLPGEIHLYQADEKRPYTIYFLHFDWYGEYPELPRRMKIPMSERRAFFARLHELARLYREPEPISDYRRYGLTLLAMDDLLRFAASARERTPLAAGGFPGSDNAKLKCIMAALYGPPFHYPGLDLLAEKSGVSRRTLSDFFRRQVGMSIKQYYLNNVMLYAESMLESRRVKIREAARLCGYSNAQNFLHAYRRWQTARKDLPPRIIDPG